MRSTCSRLRTASVVAMERAFAWTAMPWKRGRRRQNGHAAENLHNQEDLLQVRDPIGAIGLRGFRRQELADIWRQVSIVAFVPSS